ncbi:MAG: aldehyde ferredoxin oxidoreductase family protein [Candidatus Helarchaeota archaeon]
MVYGYIGKYLRVDLGAEALEEFEIEEKILKKFIGGLGLGAYFAYKEIPADADGLSPENLLCFMTGPITASGAPACSRYEVISKSPVNNLIGAANAGGFFGPELKLSGFDGIIFQNKAKSPVYLKIENGEAELRDASKLWGLDTYETEDRIHEELNDKSFRIASIGPAGENLVKFASIINDKGRALGRCGIGAVMGSKNLKAIACKRKKGMKVPIFKEDKFKDLSKKVNKKFKTNFAMKFFSTHGTPLFITLGSIVGDVPVKNFTKEWMKKFDKITASEMMRTILVRNTTCYGCPIACKRHVKVDHPKYKVEPGSGPEYETLASLGSNCMINNIYALAKANEICNRNGLDTISAGGVVAFSMEAYEKGLITKDDLGFELHWGDADAMIRMIKNIIERKGIAKSLGEGTRKFATELGEAASEFVVEVKGIEIPMHEPRANWTMALNYATHPLGAKHTAAGTSIMNMFEIPNPSLGFSGDKNIRTLDRFSPIGKAQACATAQNFHCMIDSLPFCLNAFSVPIISIRYVSVFTALLTGWPQKFKSIFLKTGERIFNLLRAFNLKHGGTKEDDYLPNRILNEPLPQMLGKGKNIMLEPMMKEYYKCRGWDLETGKIKKEKLEELELDDIVKM